MQDLDERSAGKNEPANGDATSRPPDAPTDPARIPDLYSFYEELCAMRLEFRRGLKRQQESSSKFGEVLDRFSTMLFAKEEEKLENVAVGESGELMLPLVEILARQLRFAQSLKKVPPPRFLGNDKAWRAWHASISEAFDIILGHYQALATTAGIVSIATEGEVFDPLAMTAVSIDESGIRENGMVVEEVAPGYRWNNRVLRPAEVTVARSKPISAKTGGAAL